MHTRSFGIDPELISKLWVKVISLSPYFSLKRVRFRVRRYRAFALPAFFLRLPVMVPVPWMLIYFHSCKFCFLLVRLVCGRWAWEHGEQSGVKQQQQQGLERRRLQQQYLQQQFARSFEEESISETEEDDDQLWDRVQYWFQI